MDIRSTSSSAAGSIIALTHHEVAAPKRQRRRARPMSATHSAIIPAGKARPISNGGLIADCPFHETGKQMLQLYPALRPFFHLLWLWGNAGRSPRTRTVYTSCAIASLS
jgi:hypothetical protein